jgi:hypothetical protein
LDADVSEVILTTPPVSHQSPETPELLGVLRLGDLPANLALLWPRPVTFVGGVPGSYEWTRQLYARLGKPGTFRMAEAVSAWSPMADA